MSRLKRTDKNQPTIVNALKACNYQVIDCSGVGRIIPGFPDLIVIGLHHEVNRIMLAFAEIKTEQGKLNENQKRFKKWLLDKWGNDAPWIEAKNVDDILRWYKAIWEG